MNNEFTKEAVQQGNLPQKHTLGELPMATLLLMLRRSGFVIKPDDYLEILKIVECFGADAMPVTGKPSEMADELAARICPLVATNEQEQQKFYYVFDQYKRATQIVPPPADEDRKPGLAAESYGLLKKYKRHILIGSGVLIVVLLFTLWSAVQPEPVSASFTVSPAVATPGDSVTFDATAVFAGREKDGARVQVIWNFGEGWTDTGKVITHSFAKAGTFIVRQKLVSSSIKVIKESDSSTITVCNSRPGITFDLSTPHDTYVDVGLNHEKPRLGEWFGLTARIADDNKEVTQKFWLHGTDTVSHGEDYKGSADSIGEYSFTFVAVIGDVNSPCTRREDYSFAIEDTLPPPQIAFQQTGDTVQVPAKVNPAWNILLLAPGIALLGASFLILYFRSHRKVPPLPPPPPARPPYEIPFANNELHLIAPDPDMQKISRQLRQKAEHEVLEINIPKSIQSTIQSGGLDDLVQTPKLQARDYLVLIDRSNPAGMLLHLFDYLVRNWREENIPIERFYYNGHFGRLFNEQYATGLTLRQLAERYRNYTLIVLGTAHELVNSAYPVIEKKLLEELNEWEQKAIVTPACYANWGREEEVLKKYFTLLPADTEGMDMLAPALQERKLNNDSYLDTCKRLYPAPERQFRKAGGLRNYLDNDEDLFQWLCAICVYSKLRWEVLIETGAAILKGRTEKLNYSTLLKLCRISWMRQGAVPENLRLELLKTLTEANEITARSVLLDMIDQVDKTVRQPGATFEEEKYSAQVINEFMLFSNDPVKNKQYTPSQFKFEQLWKSNRLTDAPLYNYITKKKTDNWNTIIKHDGENVSVHTYFAEEVKRINRATRKKIWPLQMFAGVLLLLFAILNLAGNNLANTGITRTLGMYLPDSSKSIMLNFIITDRTCILGSRRNNLEATITVNADLHLLTLTQPDSLIADAVSVIRYASSTELPFKEAVNGRCFLDVSWLDSSGKKTLSQALPAITYTVMEVQLPGCDSVPDLRDIATVDTTKPAADTTLSNTYSCGLSVASLPASLDEMWYNQAGGVKIRLDLRLQRIYYSISFDQVYTTFSFNQICRSQKGTYKIVTNSSRSGPTLIFIRNIRSTSFELSTCQLTLPTDEQVQQANETNCGPFRTMTLYYPQQFTPLSNTIYIPVNGKNYVESERKKILAFRPDNSNRVVLDSAIVQLNDFYTPPDQRTARTRAIFQNFPFKDFPDNSSTETFEGSPFDRDYVVVTPGKTKPDPCAKAYISISEAEKEIARDLICRLNLSNSNIHEIPSQLREMPSLQYLDIRNNYLTDKDSITIRNILPPKCQLLFTPQLRNDYNQAPEDLPANDQPWKFITQVNLDNEHFPLSNQRELVKQIADQLMTNEKAQIKIVAYYATDAQKTQAEKRAGTFKYYFTLTFKSKMPFADRITTELVPLSQRKQLQAQGVSYFFQSAPEYVDVFGINITSPTNKN